MTTKFTLRMLLLFSILLIRTETHAQHEDIPYQDVTKICDVCNCKSTTDINKRLHQTLDCTMKDFQHLLSRWPTQFGTNHKDTDLVAIYSGNSIPLLQQLPATNATLTFACRHCSIKRLQVPLFVDVPNIVRLDLSWNALSSDELTPDLFRGPFGNTRYEPIALLDLNLGHNKLHTLDKKLFEHTPQMRKLNLANNQFGVLDGPTVLALASAKELKVLDLSNNGLLLLPETNFFQSLNQLNELNLAGNKFSVLPNNLQLLGKHLQSLNIAGNPITTIDEKSFQGLTMLKRLNISDIASLKTIGNNTFRQLTALEYLYATHNEKLDQFDLSSLVQCKNLTLLDLSNGGLSTIIVSDMNDTGNDNKSLVWPKLHTLEIAGNLWYCGCDLLKSLEYAGNQYQNAHEARCDTPYILAGTQISNLTAKQICAMQIPKKYRIVEEDPPRFLRKRYIILTVIIASVVVVIGLIIGFIVVCVRRRLKGDNYGVEPIRYTSVRGSNLSAAFANANAHNNAQNANAATAASSQA